MLLAAAVGNLKRGSFLEQPDFIRFRCYDGIHPNKEDHPLICDQLLDFLRTDYRYLLNER